MRIDVDSANFETEVLERSRSVPVVVDFWAAWCGPCRQLAPVLERAVEARDGQVVLAKLDADASPELAQQYQIRGIPAVKAFRDGAVVGEFVGAVPKATVDAFLDRLLPNEVDNLVAVGDEESLRRAVELEPDRVEAALPLARLLHARGENEEALELLRRIPGSFPAEGLAARIELENQHLPELEPAWEELGTGRVEPALDLLLSALPGSGSRRDLLRRVVVGLLDELQPDDAGDYRRRLASALY
ncbi:MAG TPA: thioredoxin domain-containing protein [Candidatus Dormibacteraeota bacterium]|nr:thioredoxin domain-containing protein [Candidatus Dormibacteraeota bacterium]